MAQRGRQLAMMLAAAVLGAYSVTTLLGSGHYIAAILVSPAIIFCVEIVRRGLRNV